MDVMKTTLWHLAEKFIQLRFHELVLDGVEVMNGHVVEWGDQRVLELGELLISLVLFCGSL